MTSLWLSSNPSKRWAEVFFLAYSPCWMIWALGILVPFQLYEHCTYYGYTLIGLAASLPCFLLPIFMQSKADLAKPWYDRYWVKANVWIAIFSYVGNYFWTHYFYKLLGAAYTLTSFRLNDVPIVMYLMTHAYFCFYHALSNVLLRRTQSSFAKSSKYLRWFAMGSVVFILSYATAYFETLTISHYPYYTFVDRARMYSVGSLFYAIYFFVSFPMFFRLDESPRGKKSSIIEFAIDALAASMLVTILLDLWRNSLGAINGEARGESLPWM